MKIPRIPGIPWWAVVMVAALPLAVWAGRKILDKLIESYEPASGQ